MAQSSELPSSVLDKGLKPGALGLVASTVIGVASTAPAYSIAATLGLVALVVGYQSAAIMLISFVPMLFIAGSMYYFNRVDPDCGTTFSWVTRAFGPLQGWMNGWATIASDVVVMPSLALIAAKYTFLLFDANGLANSVLWVTVLGCGFIVGMTVICYLGIELNARTQFVLLAAEIVVLAVFAVVALVKVLALHHAGSVTPAWSWVNPFSVKSWSSLSAGVLLAVFIYWGWDTSGSVNEETAGSTRTPGVAMVLSTVVLLAIYVIISVAATAFAGTQFLGAHSDDVLSAMAKAVLGSPWDKLLILAVLTSAAASAQTTILPTARTTLSMAAHGALPRSFAATHEKYLTPTWSTIWMGVASIVWYIFLVVVNHDEAVLFDSISGLGFSICFYYAVTGFACPVYFRRFLLRSTKNFVCMGVAPILGSAALTWVFVKSAFVYWNPANAYSPPWFKFGSFSGVGAPFVIGIGILLLGIPLMFWQRRATHEFFERKLEVAETLEEGSAPGAVLGEGDIESHVI
ncbi:MAG: APC family permease [Acidimicrobiales bacterium]|jgi:amino acid transporter